MAVPDPLLAPLAACSNEEEWGQLVGRLLTEHVEPLMRAVVRRRLRFAALDGQDVCATALLRLFARLRSLRQDGGAIADLRAYAIVATNHACDEYFRARFPLRARLKNRVRYALTHRAGLALWQSPAGEWLAGRNDWAGRTDALPAPQLPTLPASGPVGADPSRELAFLFERLGRPLALDDLVDLLAERWGVRDEPAAPLGESLAAAGPSAPSGDDGAYLRRMWAEVLALPPRQRAALLLNLRDPAGGDALSLVPLAGVASLRELAAALEMEPAALATLLRELPLPDSRIAERLGLTRQQVINLRKSARERLARRLAADEPSSRQP
jgi:DNA-directed RNA polymerase specialized sigma24 family protein